MSEDLILVVGSDDKYALALAVMLHSALKSIESASHVRIVIIDGGISARNRTRIERVAARGDQSFALEWYDVDIHDFAGLKIAWWTSPAAYLRFLAPHVVSEPATWAIYLDSDVLVRSDLSDLWTQRAQDDEYVHAVRDYWHENFGSVLGTERCRLIGVDPTAPYFNTGVMLINLAKWRAEAVAERVLTFATEHAGYLQFPDQDALNGVIGRDWAELDSHWNVMLNATERYIRSTNPSAGTSKIATLRAKLIDKAAILHFTGHVKPWVPGHTGAPGREYRRCLFSSGWFDSYWEQLLWTFRFWILTPAAIARRTYAVVREYLRARLVPRTG